MANAEVSLQQKGFGRTMRRDTWWIQPLVVFIGLSSFVIYATWAAFQGKYFEWGPYLSPFYSPLLFGDSAHAWFGSGPALLSGISPALLILWMPAGFRLTCYYYRGAYYKSFWADPPSCAVSEPRNKYLGEQSFPLILQNIHRYFLYLALPFLLVLAYDFWKAMWFEGSFGIGVGTLVLGLNVILLAGYTFGCHSLRHLIGGGIDELSKQTVCHLAYRQVSRFNRKHMNWAWCSLIWVMFSDLYVRMLAMGIWHDWRIF
jgi:hypothetical protein